MSAVAPSSPEELHRAIERLLYREARLLDAGRFEEWLELFTPDGVYWVPSQPGQTDPLGVASIIYEDRGLLAMRVQRLAHPQAHVMAPAPRTTHLVSNITVESGPDDGEHHVGSALLMVEHRDTRQRIFSGQCTHHLRPQDGSLKIALKRVDLANCDAIQGALTIPL